MKPATLLMRPMTPTRFIMVGGFLGAGKTTALLALARRFSAEGLRVGLITNDQASDLVDSATLRARGLRVEEIAGGCFCCKFEDLARAAERLRGEAASESDGEIRDDAAFPHVLLGEPVGSCTDLVATVVNPLKRLYGMEFSVAPYTVLVDPVRAEQIFLKPGFGGFSSKVAYIYRKQLEEADGILLNKIDSLDSGRAGAILAALAAEFPGRRLLRVSARTGQGFEAWIDLLGERGPFGRNIVEVDYDTYAEGEAELGWLNARVVVEAGRPFSGDDLVIDLLGRMAAAFASARVEPAHLKVLFADGDGSAAASVVRSDAAPALSLAIGRASVSGTLTVNARVHVDPALVRRAVETALAGSARDRGLAIRVETIADLKPARPVPTHRDRRPVL